MNGAESLVRTLLANGVDTCFANPGTSEMHFVAALDRVVGVRCVLVATGTNPYEKLAALDADAVFEDLTDLGRLLDVISSD